MRSPIHKICQLMNEKEMRSHVDKVCQHTYPYNHYSIHVDCTIDKRIVNIHIALITYVEQINCIKIACWQP